MCAVSSLVMVAVVDVVYIVHASYSLRTRSAKGFKWTTYSDECTRMWPEFDRIPFVF